MSYIPRRGDIVRINFDPSVGKEITKYRPALVLSPQQANDQLGMCYVAPITSTVRGIGLEVPLPDDMTTEGVAQSWQVRSFDWVDRKAQFVEKAPDSMLDDVVQKVVMLLGTKVQK